ncbi:MAG: hypothetical protein ABI740_03980 [Alphaproteobacteria bacterium]
MKMNWFATAIAAVTFTPAAFAQEAASAPTPHRESAYVTFSAGIAGATD